MEDEGRLTPKDVATASENLKSFMELMKAEALSRGTTGWIIGASTPRSTSSNGIPCSSVFPLALAARVAG